jgi:CHAD domain-containing protein
MLKKKKQQKYFKKRWKAVLVHLNSFVYRRDPEALHRLRVEVKKIKALAWFSEKCSEDVHFSKPMKRILEVFHDAGEIRSAMLALKLLKKYGIKNQKFSALERNVLSSGTTQFRLKKAIHIKNINIACKDMVGRFEDIEKKYILRIFKKELHKLAQSFSSRDAGKKLHDDRKRIKNLLYIYKMLPGPLANDLNLNTSYLDSIQEAIGKWHDPYSMIGLMKEDGIDNKEVKNKLRSQVKKCEKNIYRLTADFKKQLQ